MAGATITETPHWAVWRLKHAHGYDPDAITEALFDAYQLSAEAREFFRPWVRERVSNELHSMERAKVRAGQPGGSSRGATGSLRGRGGFRAVSQRRSGPDSLRGNDPRLRFLDCYVPGTTDPQTGKPKLFRHLTEQDMRERERMFGVLEDASRRGRMTYAWASGVLQEHHVRTLDELDAEVILAELPEGGVSI